MERYVAGNTIVPSASIEESMHRCYETADRWIIHRWTIGFRPLVRINRYRRLIPSPLRRRDESNRFVCIADPLPRYIFLLFLFVGIFLVKRWGTGSPDRRLTSFHRKGRRNINDVKTRSGIFYLSFKRVMPDQLVITSLKELDSFPSTAGTKHILFIKHSSGRRKRIA